MTFTVFERLILLNILPAQGDLTTIRIVHTLREELSFSEAEHAALQLRTENNTVLWQQEADVPKEIEVGPKAAAIIRDVFLDLDKKKSLREEHLPLYERFVEAV